MKKILLILLLLITFSTSSAMSHSEFVKFLSYKIAEEYVPMNYVIIRQDRDYCQEPPKISYMVTLTRYGVSTEFGLKLTKMLIEEKFSFKFLRTDMRDNLKILRYILSTDDAEYILSIGSRYEDGYNTILIYLTRSPL